MHTLFADQSLFLHINIYQSHSMTLSHAFSYGLYVKKQNKNKNKKEKGK